MIVFPSFSFKFFKIANNSLVFLLSKFPVGSSAIIILGSLTRALAIAVRCFCPPEHSSGYLFKRPSMPRFLAISCTLFLFHYFLLCSLIMEMQYFLPMLNNPINYILEK